MGARLILRREVAFDGGAAWGLNHFDVTIEVKASDPTVVLALGFESPRTGWTSAGEPADLADGSREWRTAWQLGEESGQHGRPMRPDLPFVPSYLVAVLAARMEKTEGACLHYRPFQDATGEPMLRACLRVVEREALAEFPASKDVWRLEQHGLGSGLGATFWVDADGRLLKADYGGAQTTRASKEAALAGLHADLAPRTAQGQG